MIVDKEYSFYPQVKKTRRSKTLVFNPCSVGKLWILLLESTMYLRCKFTHLATSLFGILCSSQLSHLVSQWILLKKSVSMSYKLLYQGFTCFYHHNEASIFPFLIWFPDYVQFGSGLQRTVPTEAFKPIAQRINLQCQWFLYICVQRSH